jgi:hypothetical protein
MVIVHAAIGRKKIVMLLIVRMVMYRVNDYCSRHGFTYIRG